MQVTLSLWPLWSINMFLCLSSNVPITLKGICKVTIKRYIFSFLEASFVDYLYILRRVRFFIDESQLVCPTLPFEV